ncbi:hypothetical protein NIES2104_65810 [Leptolyngbya sp. NIES-2104]|nr:hypothetical protein NIES2104_65810 [Leptolyngbya sp. NIES-2104]
MVFAEGFVSNHLHYRGYLTSASVKGMSRARVVYRFNFSKLLTRLNYRFQRKKLARCPSLSK